MNDFLTLVLALVFPWFLAGIAVSINVLLIPFYRKFKKPVLVAFMLPASLALILAVVVSLLTSIEYPLIGGGIYFAQSVLAYVLSYYKLDNREKCLAPYGYCHTYNALLIPTVWIVESEEERSRIDEYVETSIKEITRKRPRKGVSNKQ